MTMNRQTAFRFASLDDFRRNQTRHYVISCVIVAMLRIVAFSDSVEVVLPPSITEQPEPEMTFKTGERVELVCIARGYPSPEYSWKKDNHLLFIIGVDMKILPSAGTLVIEDSSSNHEGVYQCLAENQYGVAVTHRVRLKQAVLDTYEMVNGGPLMVQRVRLGEELTLHCNPPYSHPPADVYWARIDRDAKMKPIERTSRLSIDHEGNLHFANVDLDDFPDRSKSTYLCVVQNRFLRSLVQGREFTLELTQQHNGLPHTPIPVRSHLLWASPTLDVAIRGRSKRLMCIFGGYPTPIVKWRKLRAAESAGRTEAGGSAVGGGGGVELVLAAVDMKDAGRYECFASNDRDDKDDVPVAHQITLIVEAAPEWLPEGFPSDVTISEEGRAEFSCHANGVPTPQVTWYSNGRPLEELEFGVRHSYAGDTLILDNVTTADIQVIQCNASNKHGYLFANAYLKVIAEPSRLVSTPPPTMVSAEDLRMVMPCRAVGAPMPRIVWLRGSPPRVISGSRFRVHTSGDLEIQMAEVGDSGLYRCSAVNKFGTASVVTHLSVRRKSLITESSGDVTIAASGDVELRCVATTDPVEMSQLRVHWQKNGHPVNHVAVDRRLATVNAVESLLRIKRAKIKDTGNYTCVASNGIDSTSRSAELIVADRPDPPFNLTLLQCHNNEAILTWFPGAENNAYVTSYVVFYASSHDAQSLHLAAEVDSGGDTRTRISGLLPWTNYTFYAAAENRMGMSGRSEPTLVPCSVPSTAPTMNPDEVCTDDRGPEYLVVTWKIIPLKFHCGEDFHYLVSYRMLDVPNSSPVEVKVDNWRQDELVIANQTEFHEFEIFVLSVNREGLGPKPEKKKGYSGEDVPLERPTNFHIRTSTLNSTSVEFAWTAVNESPDMIRGFFRGYQVRFWRDSDDPVEVRTHDVIFNIWTPCPPLIDPSSWRNRRDDKKDDGTRRTCRWTTPVVGRTDRLWPFSSIKAAVLVISASKAGNLSDIIEFRTPEGVPEAVKSLRLVEVGSHHVRLSWSPPEVPNGILTGFIIGHRKATETDSNEIRVSRHQLDKKLRDLKPSTRYSFYVLGLTSARRGVSSNIEAETRAVSAPDQPHLSALEFGDSFVVVHWKLTTDDHVTPLNPGLNFRLEYRMQGNVSWNVTEEELHHNWINLTDVDTDAVYEAKVIAINAFGEETASDAVLIGLHLDKGLVSEPSSVKWPWLVTGLGLLVFVCSSIGLSCYLVCRRRCGTYSVQEHQQLHGCKSDSSIDDITNSRNDFLQQVQERGNPKLEYCRKESSESLEKSTERSMSGISEVTQFNEDGSFIGQYMDLKPKELEPDVTIPSAMSVLI